MLKTFDGAGEIIEDLATWNTAAVTDMSYMFHQASKFNCDLGNWDVSAVTDMSAMYVPEVNLYPGCHHFLTCSFCLMPSP